MKIVVRKNKQGESLNRRGEVTRDFKRKKVKEVKKTTKE